MELVYPGSDDHTLSGVNAELPTALSDSDLEELMQNEIFKGIGLLSQSTVDALALHCWSSFQTGTFTAAQIGRGSQKSRHTEVRGDSLLWIDDWEAESVTHSYHDFLLALQAQLREALLLPLRRFEGHFSVYQAGSFYRRHRDQHSGNPHRQVTCILYLSDSDEEDGGRLRAWNSRGREFVIRPQKGLFVCFLSALVEHEVEEALKTRMSLTGWMRDDELLPFSPLVFR